jgi:hypothetical protein
MIMAGKKRSPGGKGVAPITRQAYLEELDSFRISGRDAIYKILEDDNPPDAAIDALDYEAFKYVKAVLEGRPISVLPNQERIYFVQEPAYGESGWLRLDSPAGKGIKHKLSDEPGVMAACSRCGGRHPLLALGKESFVYDGAPQQDWPVFYICTKPVKVYKVGVAKRDPSPQRYPLN